MLDTISRGNTAESAVVNAFAAVGLRVFVPFGGGHALDLAVLWREGGFVRVQVKHGRVRNGCIEFNTVGTDHGSGGRDYHECVDVIAVWAQELDRVYVVPIADCPKRRGYLRLVAAANNQHAGVRMAADYEFSRWLEDMAGEDLGLRATIGSAAR